MKITEGISKTSSMIKDVVYICGLIFAIYLFLGKKAVEKDRSVQSEIELKQEVTDLKDSVNKLVKQNINITDTLGVIYKNQLAANKQIKKINNGLVNHFKQTERIEELFNWTIE